MSLNAEFILIDADAIEHVAAGGGLFPDCSHGTRSGSPGCQPAFPSSNLQSSGLSLQGDIHKP